MTRTIEAIRFAGDIVMVLSAWFHKPSVIIMGLVLIVIAWCSGWFRKGNSQPRYYLVKKGADNSEHP